MDKYFLPVCTEIFSSSTEKTVLFEDTLPEYCPGIKKILKADAITGIPEALLSGGVINISVPCDIRLVYIAENGNLKSVSFTHSIDASFDASRLASEYGDAAIYSKACASKVYAKPKSPRNFEAKLEVPISVCAYVFEDTPLFTPDTSGDTETICTEANMTERSIAVSEGEISDTVTLDSSLPAAAELIDRSLCLYDIKTKCEDGRLKYNGNSVFKCTYKTVETANNDGSEYIYLKKEIPFDGEIISDKITKDSKAVIDTSLTALDVSLSSDPYGENRIIVISASYSTHAEIFNLNEAKFTYDGFCSLYECNFKSTVYCYDELTDIIDKSAKMTEEIPINGTNITEITDGELKLGAYYTEHSNAGVYAVSKAYAVITGSDDKGEPVCIEHRFVIKQIIDETALTSDRKYIICCKAMPIDVTLKDGTLNFEYAFKTDGAVLEKRCTTAISDAEIFYDKPKPACRSEYIIYYPDKKETLWDIAKKYEIPQKKLAEANGIDESQTLSRKTVLIPCAL